MEIYTLKNKQRMSFVLRYLETFDVYSSYMEFYSPKNKESAKSAASRILSDPEVQLFMDSIILNGIELSKMKSEMLLGKVIGNLVEIADAPAYLGLSNKLSANKILLDAIVGNGYGPTLVKHFEVAEADKRKQMEVSSANSASEVIEASLVDSASEVNLLVDSANSANPVNSSKVKDVDEI